MNDETLERLVAHTPLKIALFGIGLDTYWGQYEGLLDRLTGYQAVIRQKLERPGVEVIDAGMVDTALKAHAAAERFKREDVAVVFLFVSTYALSSTVLPVVQKTGAPVIVLNLQPVKAIDYARFNALGNRTKMTGEWLAHCQACSIPEIASVFNRAQIRFHQITGTLHDDPIAWTEIDEWIEAAQVARAMATNRLGLLGHYYNGMLDIYSDPTQHAAFFGSHIEHVEMTELKALRETVSESELAVKVAQIHAEFEVMPDCSAAELERAARTAVALDKLAEGHDLGALAYFYNGTGDSVYEDIIASVIVGCSMLTAHHIPVAGEYEVKNAQAMKIMDCFGVGGSFTEFYAMDFNDDIILMGHDGPGHIAIAEGKPKLKPLSEFHGKVGQGLSVEMVVRHGPVTLLSVIQSFDGKLRLLVAEAETVPGPILEIGNTNSRYRFSLGARGFIDAWCRHGPAHHCAVGIGHIAGKIEKLGSLIGMETIRVC
ncbi:MAG: arabinose isomerase [Anaerolineae bacterium]|nr:arabinose isomerase [Anaerolineae bacterium]NUQ05292.1 arabinose isomerase [Anaerolineae bacterium]